MHRFETGRDVYPSNWSLTQCSLHVYRFTYTHVHVPSGLRYEDILNENEKEIAEGLELADPDVIIGRTRRLKRAIDLNFKRKNFLDYAPDVDQETFKKEFYDDVDKIKARDAEYALLNAHNK